MTEAQEKRWQLSNTGSEDEYEGKNETFGAGLD